MLIGSCPLFSLLWSSILVKQRSPCCRQKLTSLHPITMTEAEEENPSGAPRAVFEMLGEMRAKRAGSSDVQFDLPFLQSVFEDPEMEFLMQTYDKLIEERTRNGELSDGVETVDEIATESADVSNGDAQELNNLLKESHLRALIDTYDQVHQQKYDADIPHVSIQENGIIENARLLRLVGIHKSKGEALGITLKVESGFLKIARILRGGSVDKQGLLNVGDIIHSVNGVDGKPLELKAQLGAAHGTITLKVEPSHLETKELPQLYMRAKFDFNPKTDSGIPCADAGLTFRNGDVLQVLDQEDPSWWQAQHVTGDRQSGIIPGQMFEERRRVSVSLDSDDVVAPLCVTLGKKKEKRRLMYNSNKNHEFDRHELVVYEEVAKIQPAQRKVIVLIGAQGVGRRSIKHRMLKAFPDRFGTSIPHTTRPQKREEVDGELYHFVAREEMDEDIAAHKFIEHGEYDEHLYGTKIDSVRSVLDEDKIPVLDVSPLALKMLRTAEFKPFVVFISAPSVAKLRELRRHSGQDADKSKPVSEKDISKTVEESKRLERDYSNFFDFVLVNENIDETFEQLMEILDQLNSDPQWVPVGWVY